MTRHLYPQQHCPQLERLEDRVVPATFTVTNQLAAGAGSIGQAVVNANNNAGVDNIVFAPTLNGRAITLQAFPLVLTDSVNITGPGGNANAILISGNDGTRVFEINPGITVNLANMTLERGQSPENGDGGAIFNQGTLTLNHLTIRNNDSTDDGGGIANTGTLTIRNSTIEANDADDDGGGIFNEGTLTVLFSRIQSNRADQDVTETGLGGGLFNTGTGSSATLIGTTIANNQAELGGGIEQTAGNPSLAVRECLIFQNLATSSGGGLRFVGGTGSVFNTTFTGNVSRGGVGGGGISQGLGTLTLTNVTVVGNTDFSNNTQSAGGIAKNGGTLNVRNTVISQNFAGTTSADDNVDTGDFNTQTNNWVGGDPRLAPLQDNGGATLSMRPLNQSSPLVDAGNNAILGTVTIDQRGFNRVVDGNLNGTVITDIGAVEFNPGVRQPIVVGAGAGSESFVKVYDQDGSLRFNILAFPGFMGGVRTATGDVNGDGIEDIIAAAGPTGGPHVRVFHGATAAEIRSFFAYGGFAGGMFVASGDINNDGFDDIITGPDVTGGPHVRVFDGSNTNNVLLDLFPYSVAFTGGVRVASGDLDGDGHDDIITAAGAGGGPHVRAFGGGGTGTLADFFAYEPSFLGGVFVAVGDVNGDGLADIITSPGAGGSPFVRVFSGGSTVNLANFFAYASGFTGGVTVAAQDRDGDSKADIITGAGPGGGPHVRSFSGDDLSEIDGFFAFAADFTQGVFVG